MSKKVFKEKQYNLGIVESYKPSKEADENSPILGSFHVKGMAVENQISQNRTKYSKEVWSQPYSFGTGGKFIDESGKLKPSTLFGSVDHPVDDRAELLLQEAAIAWSDVTRNPDGSWDGSADILNNPQGKLIKTFLDYVKRRGGGDLLGVSSRALGESVLSENNGEQYEAIVPDSFELMSFDFVYNPSFKSAVAKLNESKNGNRVSLVESVRNLAKEDKENSKYYEAVAETLNEEPKETLTENANMMEAMQKLHTDLQANQNYDDVEFIENSDGSFTFNFIYDNIGLVLEVDNTGCSMLSDMEHVPIHAGCKLPNIENLTFTLMSQLPLYKMYQTVLGTLQRFGEGANTMNQKELKNSKTNFNSELIVEASKDADQIDEEIEKEIDEKEIDAAEEELDEELEELDIEDEEDSEEDEDSEEVPEDEEEVTPDSMQEEIRELREMLQEIRDFLIPVEDPEMELTDEELEDEDLEELELADEDLEEDEDEEPEEDEEPAVLDELTEEELDELSDEELEYLAALDV